MFTARSYVKLGIALGLSYVVMFLLSMWTIRQWDHFYVNASILVCQESNITDPEIVELCGSIVKAQQEEIAQMQEILERY